MEYVGGSVFVCSFKHILRRGELVILSQTQGFSRQPF